MFEKKSFKVNGAECGIEAIALAVTTSFGGFLFGYDIGQISGLLLLKDFTRRFGQARANGDAVWLPVTLSLIVSLMSIGCMIGALSGAYTADWFGRRGCLRLGVTAYLLGTFIQITASRNWIQIVGGRFCAGLGIGSLSVGVPMLQSECSPREVRGAVVASYQLMITLGILVSNLVNFGVRSIEESGWSWRIVILVGMFCSLPLRLGILFLPESPSWLASRGDWQGARTSLARLRGMKHDPQNVLVENDFNEMRLILESQGQVGTGTWMECFRRDPVIPKLRYRTLLGCAIHFCQQWIGINYFFYYGATIFESAGVRDPLLIQLILGAVNFVMTFYGLYVVERFGRRWPLFLGALWQAACLLVFASVGTLLKVTGREQSSISGTVMIVSACMFIASFAGTWGPMGWVVVSEMFPVRTRAKQASLATASNWLGNFLVGFLTPFADAHISYMFGFVFFATNLAAALIVWFFLYESRTLGLENVDLMYGQPELTARSSSRWVPPGYITRKIRHEGHLRRMSLNQAAVIDDGAHANDSGGVPTEVSSEKV